jgi:hypothetical protein
MQVATFDEHAFHRDHPKAMTELLVWVWCDAARVGGAL